jgi:uncharacterized Zn finger protein
VARIRSRTASSECPTCGWPESGVLDFLEDDTGCVVAIVLECRACGLVHMLRRD